ncbi:hypothetical protein ACJMK2_013858 [Sinanodonta woodiana]|uniref:SGNH hydrolase-type esterase domain-containing protein n=1 Tax=Sinanodonta woodiana TaxID=1069815 RepID=A0ABD3UYS3_SINWO
MLVLLVGHSIIARLSQSLALLNLCRVQNNLQIQFHGVPGAWATRFFFLHWRVPVPPPNIVFLQVGENKIGYTDPDLIILNMLSLCMMLLQNGVSSVMVGAMIPRFNPRRVSVSQYTRRIRYINSSLDQTLRDMSRVTFHGLIEFRPRYLHVDEVHFNSRGQIWFLQHNLTCIYCRFFIEILHRTLILLDYEF